MLFRIKFWNKWSVTWLYCDIFKTSVFGGHGGGQGGQSRGLGGPILTLHQNSPVEYCSELSSETYDMSHDYVAIILKTSVFGVMKGVEGVKVAV